jgi:hypothetical protein
MNLAMNLTPLLSQKQCGGIREAVQLDNLVVLRSDQPKGELSGELSRELVGSCEAHNSLFPPYAKPPKNTHRPFQDWVSL